MNHTLVFTTAQFMSLCSAIVLISGAVTAIMNVVSKAAAPTKLINSRLESLELRMKQHDEFFKRDLMRFEELEAGNRVTQRAILALLSHGIDGNDVSTLKEAKRDLEKWLIER